MRLRLAAEPDPQQSDQLTDCYIHARTADRDPDRGPDKNPGPDADDFPD